VDADEAGAAGDEDELRGGRRGWRRGIEHKGSLHQQTECSF
jgi:hypothetical protein